MIKIKKIVKLENPEMDFIGFEIDIEVDGKIIKESFDDYDYWMGKVNGEERFKTRIRENHDKTPKELKKIFDADQVVNTNKETIINKFNNKVIL